MIRFPLLISIVLLFSCNSEDGVHKEYYDSGELQKEYEIKNGLRNGYFKYYSKSGQLILEYFNVDNLRHGEIKKYYETGELESKGFYENNKVIWTEFFDHNGVKLNRFEGDNATFYSYYKDLNLASKEFMTYVYDSVKTDSLLFIQADSAFYYAKEPNEIIFKYWLMPDKKYKVQHIKENLDPMVLNTWDSVKALRDSLFSTESGYIPTVHKK